MKSISIKGDDKHYHIPTTTNDITVGDYIKFLQKLEEYKIFANLDQETIEDIKDKELPSEDDLTEQMIKEMQFFADMIAIASDIPYEVIYSRMSPEVIMKIFNLISFEPVENPHFRPYFEFMDCTEEEFAELTYQVQKAEKEFQSTKVWDFTSLKKRRKVWETKRDALVQKTSVRFFIAEDLGDDNLRQWIHTEQVKKRLSEIGTSESSKSYELMPELIAHIARPMGEKYDIKQVHRRIEIFKNLPLSVAKEISDFFLAIQKEYFNRSKMSLNLTDPNSIQNPSKSNIVIIGDGSLLSEN